MKSLSEHELAHVTGGFGALLGPLLQAAGPIMNGVAGIIGAAKSGGGGGGGGAAPAGPPPQAPPASAAMAGGGGSSTGSTSADGLTQISTSVSITR
jgi:bacteriocin-like protein